MNDGSDGRPATAAVAETVTLTLDAGVARDLLQALTLALGPGRGTGRRTAVTEKGSSDNPSKR